MFNTRSVLALVVSLSLIGGTPAVLADPGNGKGNPHGNQMDGGKGNKGNKGNQGGHDNHGGPGNSRRRRPEGQRRRQLGLGTAYRRRRGTGDPRRQPRLLEPGAGPAARHPEEPGARQAAAARHRQETRRPPVSRLPHYDGYEWMQAGTDLLLVAVATGLIYEVLDNVLD